MTTVYTLEQIFPALRNASAEEVPVMQDGMKMVTERPAEMPLMDLKYALNDSAREIVKRYTNVA